MMHDVFSIVVILGILVTFAPQQIRIVRKRTSLGISPHFMLLGVTSVLAQLINIVLLQASVVQACRSGSATCLSDVLGIVQVAVLTVSLGANFLLFLVYYPKPWSETSEGRQVMTCVKLFLSFVVACASVLISSFIAFEYESVQMMMIGRFFGFVCAILSCIQYVPQLMRTWKTKTVGALSTLTLAIQAPGSFFFAYTLASRPATDLSVWGSFFVSGCFQLTLAILCFLLEPDDADDWREIFMEDGDDNPEERWLLGVT